MAEEKEMKIIFEPGCFDGFEGSQEELDELVAEIKKLVTSGDLFEKAKPVTEEHILDLPEEEQERLLQWLERDITQPSERKLN